MDASAVEVGAAVAGRDGAASEVCGSRLGGGGSSFSCRDAGFGLSSSDGDGMEAACPDAATPSVEGGVASVFAGEGSFSTADADAARKRVVWGKSGSVR